ncbi:uncharacterized protein LOC107024823 [Solanum pennellii]|uniref:Uncharacterized protein LOC107024823 n=1 Tax=Solanum pennellii TaxID=28526 RepID=A0ABM1H718_SOLPN|nr:uncharacterized protein LOC107024823 [Solanum pennellii]
MGDFSSVSAYCQHLKSLSNQLKNVGSPVDNNRLVLQLVAGLTEPYKGVARPVLTLEEADLAKKAAHRSSSAMVARDSNDSDDIVDHSSSHRNTKGGKRNQYIQNNRNKNGDREGRMSGSGNGGEAGGVGQMGHGNIRGGG